MPDLTEAEQEVLNVLAKQRAKGRKKYATNGLNFKLKNPEVWLDYAIEEAADQLQYLVCMKMKYKEANPK